MTAPHLFYQLHRLNLNQHQFGDFATVCQSFDSLKPSSYKDGSFRLRRYSRFVFDKDRQTLNLQANASFVQGDDLNQFQGNVARTYDDLTAETYNSQAFLALINDFVKSTDLPSPCLIEVHQMRIIAKDGNDSAAAAPEGIHQDGFDYVSIFTAARHNVTAGELALWHSPSDKTPIATLNPEVGDVCLVNDKLLWHSASDIKIKGQDSGYWDLFVFTAHHQPATLAA